MGSISTFIAANLIPRPAGRQLRVLLHRVAERRQSLNPHFQLVAAADGTDATGRAGQNHVTGHQRHVLGDEAHQGGGLENKLAGVGILAKLSVLKLLDP